MTELSLVDFGYLKLMSGTVSAIILEDTNENVAHHKTTTAPPPI